MRVTRLVMGCLVAAMLLMGLTAPAVGAAEPGGISGTVTDSDGDPVEGVLVCASGFTVFDSACFYTEVDGTYAITDLEPDSYLVHYDTIQLPFVDEFYDDTFDQDTAVPVAVADATVTTGIDATLTRYGSIAGEVTSEAGGPVDGAFVCVEGQQPPFAGSCGISDATGAYVASSVPPGDYAVQFIHSDFVLEWYDDTTRDNATLVTVTEGAQTGGVDAALVPLAEPEPISGTVTDAEGDPVEGAWVFAYRDTDGFAPTAIVLSAADGTYAFDDLPDGTYRIGFAAVGRTDLAGEWYDGVYLRSEAEPLVVTRGTTVAHAGVDASFVTTGRLSGTITGPTGAPVAGARISLYLPTDGLYSLRWATTAADGTYTFPVPTLGAGSYKVAIRPPAGSGLRAEWFDNVATRAAATAIPLGPGISATASAQLSAQ